MSVPRALSKHLALWLAAGGALPAACRAPERTADPVSAAEFEARVASAVDERLRELFPEVRGPISRDAIVGALAVPASESDALAGSDAARAQAIAALRRGDDEPALQLLSEIAADREAQAARALRAAGDVEGALQGYARALDIAPHSTSLRRERGETALDDGIARGDRARIEAAAADFQEATRRARGHDPDAARAWLGASRAARALGDRPRALEAARRAFAAQRDARELETAGETAERTLAEALVASLDGADPSARDALLREARRALEALVARTPDEPWAWARLSDVLRRQGAVADASGAANRGLRILPREPLLAEALADAARAHGGRAAVVATFEDIERRDPGDAGAVWRPAEERYERALESLAAGSRDPEVEAGFREAGRGFLRAGALAPDRRTEANAAVARCLAGVGHALRGRDELASARRAFLEADERDPRALTEPLAPGLATGVEALRGIAATQRERGEDPSRDDAADQLAEAAATYVELRRIAPRDAEEAVLVARLARNAALACETRARVAIERGRSDVARSEMARARALMESAYVAATDAARLSPHDAAVVREPGRILVHFLQRDVAPAQTALTNAVALYEGEVARARAAAEETGVESVEREQRARRLEEAESQLGDTYQDLGVLHLALKSDPIRAKAWFEKALGTGPDPRDDLRGPDGWIARCDAAIASGADSRPAPEKRWGALSER